MAAKKFDLQFVVDVPPDDYTIDIFHKELAKIFINKYGVDVMKKVVGEIDKH